MTKKLENRISWVVIVVSLLYIGSQSIEIIPENDHVHFRTVFTY